MNTTKSITKQIKNHDWKKSKNGRHVVNWNITIPLIAGGNLAEMCQQLKKQRKSTAATKSEKVIEDYSLQKKSIHTWKIPGIKRN